MIAQQRLISNAARIELAEPNAAMRQLLGRDAPKAAQPLQRESKRLTASTVSCEIPLGLRHGAVASWTVSMRLVISLLTAVCFICGIEGTGHAQIVPVGHQDLILEWLLALPGTRLR